MTTYGETQEYNTGRINIDTSSLSNGSIFGTTISWVQGQYGTALMSSGAVSNGDGYVRFENFNLNGVSGAVSVWVKDPGPGSGADVLYNFMSSNRTRLLVGPGSISYNKGNPNTTVIPQTAISAGSWHHTVLNWYPSGDSTTGSMWAEAWIDNVIMGSAVYRDNAEAISGVLFGISMAGAEPGNGQLDDFRTYNRTLTSGEIGSLFEGRNVKEDLIIWFRMDENTGSIAYNSVAGSLSYFTPSLNGIIQSISIENDLEADYGELWFNTSGTGEALAYKASGLDSSSTQYPLVYGETVDNTTGSPWTKLQRVINGPIEIIGSNMGNLTRIDNIKVRYL